MSYPIFFSFVLDPKGALLIRIYFRGFYRVSNRDLETSHRDELTHADLPRFYLCISETIKQSMIDITMGNCTTFDKKIDTGAEVALEGS